MLILLLPTVARSFAWKDCHLEDTRINVRRCGMNQTGRYLDGAAPDGLMGLGIGEISVPSFLARAGLVKNSFSMCFDEDESGRIFFGDQGPAAQKYTPFLPLNRK